MISTDTPNNSILDHRPHRWLHGFAPRPGGTSVTTDGHDARNAARGRGAGLGGCIRACVERGRGAAVPGHGRARRHRRTRAVGAGGDHPGGHGGRYRLWAGRRGCGAGRGGGSGGRVYAVDADPRAVRLAAELARRSGLPQVSTDAADAAATGLPAGSVDVAMIRNVLAHNGGRRAEDRRSPRRTGPTRRLRLPGRRRWARGAGPASRSGPGGSAGPLLQSALRPGERHPDRAAARRAAGGCRPRGDLVHRPVRDPPLAGRGARSGLGGPDRSNRGGYGRHCGRRALGRGLPARRRRATAANPLRAGVHWDRPPGLLRSGRGALVRLRASRSAGGAGPICRTFDRYERDPANGGIVGVDEVLGTEVLVGAENPVTSCNLHVFVDEAAEPVSS